MIKTKELLTLLKAHYGGVSDYRLAKNLDVTPQAVSKWKKGNHTLSDEMAIRVAEILGLDTDYVLLSIYAERTKGDAASHAFARAAELLRPDNSPLSLCQQRDFFQIA